MDVDIHGSYLPNTSTWMWSVLSMDIQLDIHPLPSLNVKQIEDREKSIAEKKIVLDKHCRHFGLRYGKYGTEENGVKSDTTNAEGSTFDAAADAAVSAALDEIQLPQHTAPYMANGFDMHNETGIVVTKDKGSSRASSSSPKIWSRSSFFPIFQRLSLFSTTTTYFLPPNEGNILFQNSHRRHA